MKNLVRVQLTDIETSKLVSALESFMTEFRIEINAVEKYEWQRELESDEMILKGVLSKLKDLKQEQMDCVQICAIPDQLTEIFSHNQ